MVANILNANNIEILKEEWVNKKNAGLKGNLALEHRGRGCGPGRPSGGRGPRPQAPAEGTRPSAPGSGWGQGAIEKKRRQTIKLKSGFFKTPPPHEKPEGVRQSLSRGPPCGMVIASDGSKKAAGVGNQTE